MGVLVAAAGLTMPSASAALCCALCGTGIALRKAHYLGLPAALLALSNAAAFPELSLSLFFSGLIVSLGRRSGKIVLFTQALWLLLAVVSFGCILAHFLNLLFGEELFDYWLARDGMGWRSSAGLAALCIALFFFLKKAPGIAEFYADRPDRQISAQGIVLMTCIGLISGIVAMEVLAKEDMSGFQRTLADALRVDAINLRDFVLESSGETERIAALMKDNRDLSKVFDAQKADGVRAIWVSDKNGRMVDLAGNRPDAFDGGIRLSLHNPAWLLWRKGLHLISTAPLYSGGMKIGELWMETDLPSLEEGFDRSLRDSGEILLCSNEKCFPSFPGESPMAYGRKGRMSIGSDGRGRILMVAYRTVDELGLGMVDRIDAGKLYSPMRSQLLFAFSAFMLISGMGGFALFRSTRPLVRSLKEEEARARAILDNIPEAVIMTDESGIVQSCNPSAQKSFGCEYESGKTVFSLLQGLSECVSGKCPENSICRKGGCSGIEGEAKRSDGTLFPYEMAVAEFFLSGARHFVCIVRDLTERMKAEDALNESREKLRSLYELSPVGIALTDMEGRYVDFNPAFEKICGYTAEELKSLDYWTLTPKKYEADEAAQLQLLESTGRYGPYEKEYRRKDGSLVPLRLNGVLITGRDGRQYIWSIIEDITESRRAEMALKESAEHTMYLLENMQTAVVVHEMDGSVSYMNAAARQFFGLEDGVRHISDLAARFFREDGSIMPYDEYPEVRVLNTGEAFYNRVMGIASEGAQEARWVLINAFPNLSQDGKVMEVIVSFIDITDRMNMEVALKQSTAELAKLNQLYLVLSRVNAVSARAASREELFYNICNILVESGGFEMVWIGLLDEAGELVPLVYAGREEGYVDILKKTGLMALDGPAALMMKTGKIQVCQDIENDPRMLPWRDEALKRGYLSSAGFPLYLGDTRIGIINAYAGEMGFFSEDILNLLGEIYESASFAIEYLDQLKKREEAEEMLRQLNADLESQVRSRTSQLEAANAELESFSYSVSHDLRAPLRSIDGFSDIISHKYGEMLDDTGRDYLGRVRRASRRMGELIEDLLELSRVGRTEIRKEEVDLSEIVREIISELDSNERSINWSVPKNMPVMADARLMKIALENLIGNAWKFTQSKEHARIEFGMHEMEGEKIYFVRDNGVGFDMKYASKLFGAFQRLHKVDEFEGTGIGLATVQRIIHRHGGRIWGEGKVGAGATFYFSL
jgi:PAS domain S-box-containing protein